MIAIHTRSSNIGEIIGMIDEIASQTNLLVLNGCVEAASVEQSPGIDQVNHAVTSMDEMTQQNAALAEQTSSASACMFEKAGEFNNLITGFKV